MQSSISLLVTFDTYENVSVIVADIMGNNAEIESIFPAKRGKINSCYVVSLKNIIEKLFIKIENNDSLSLCYDNTSLLLQKTAPSFL